jgi:hypothetical protein
VVELPDLRGLLPGLLFSWVSCSCGAMGILLSDILFMQISICFRAHSGIPNAIHEPCRQSYGLWHAAVLAEGQLL